MKIPVQVCLLTLSCAFLLGTTAEAQSPPIQLVIHSGTGFFVNSQNIVTNAHVVNGCSAVTVKGAVPEQAATVRFLDKKQDLAIIEVNTPSQYYVPLRYNTDDIRTGDKLMIIGYPGREGMQGKYKVATTQVEDVKTNEADESKWLYVTDVFEHGNSGGPVFDTSGNVIGVVVAKVTGHKTDPITHIISDKQLGVVITLKTLEKFMVANDIFSRTAASGLSSSDNYIAQQALNYIVNVQCRT